MYYLGLSKKPKIKPKPKSMKIRDLQQIIIKKLGTNGFYPNATSDDTVIGNEWYHPAGGATSTKEVANAYAKEYRKYIGIPGSVRIKYLKNAHILTKNGKWTKKPAYVIFIAEPVLFG